MQTISPPRLVLADPEALLGDHLRALGLPDTVTRLHLHAPKPGPLAWCEPGTIHVRPPAQIEGFWTKGGLGDRMLAHEAVHTAQFSASFAPSSPMDLEIEAEYLAPRLAAGEACRVQLAAAPGRLHWGRAGHYYTVYLAGLVAGANETMAQRMAFYSQTPDLVSEFDATAQVANRLEILDLRWESPVGAFAGQDRGVRPADPEVCLDVIEGLHCLTGGPVTLERRKRKDILMNAAYGSLEFGIALHAFGDAYAHAFNSSMFNHDYGHAKRFHWPDEINMHQQVYKEYYSDLVWVFMAKVAKRSARRAPGAPSADKIADDLDSMARSMPDGDDEPTQIPFLSGLITQVSGSPFVTSYRPANECVPWADFITTAPAAALKLGGPQGFDAIFQAIMGYAHQWRRSTPDSRPLEERLKAAKAKRKVEGEITRAQADVMRGGFQP